MLDLLPSTAAAGMAISRHSARQRGASLHFRQSRPYTAGDEPRRIDWNLLARTEKYFVREYEQETDRQTLIVVDASGSMAYGEGSLNKLQWALQLAAAFIYVLSVHQEPVGWAVVAGRDGTAGKGGQIAALAPGRSQGVLLRFADVADGLLGGGHVEHSLRDVALPLRQGTVILISDLLFAMADLERWMQRVAGTGHMPTLVRVNHPAERQFPFDAWAELTGLEGEPVCAVEGPAVRRLYSENLAAHERAICSAAVRYRARVQWNTTSQPIIEAARQWAGLGAASVIDARGKDGRV